MIFSRYSGAFKDGVARSRMFNQLAERRREKLARLLARSGRFGDPGQLARRSVGVTFAVAAISVPMGLFLGLLFWRPLAVLCTAPIMAYTYPELVLNDAVTSRREGVERELPFFAILVNVLSGAGASLYSVLESGAGSGMFAAMEREALLLRRNVVVFGSNPVDALERVAMNHPSRKFADFILGYCSKVRSGGDVQGYLTGESASLLGSLERDWGRYATRVGTVGSLMVTVFGVVPLLLLVVAFFSSAFATEGLAVFALVAVPLLSTALIAMSGRMQPMKDDALRGNWVLGIAAAAPSALPGMVMGEAWLAVAISLLAFTLVYGVSVRSQRRVAREEGAALVGFLGDLTEFKRLEYDLGRSIITIASRSHYGESFDRLLRKLAARLRNGVPLDKAASDARTPLGRMVFFVLGQMSYSGGGTVDTMFQLSHYTTRMIQMKEESRTEVKPYLILSYVTPLLLVFGVAFVGGVLGSFRGTGLSGGFPLSGYGIPPGLLQAANLLIVTSAAALGVVGAKLGDLTARNTLRASTNVAMAVALSVAVPLLNVGALIK